MENKARKYPNSLTHCKNSATRDTERDASAGAKMNQQVHEQNGRLQSLESLTTEKRIENGGSHPSDTTDAAEDRSDVTAHFCRGPQKMSAGGRDWSRCRPTDE